VAFTVCLEKKQEREKEAVSVAFNEKGTSFTRTGSFRQATLTERLEDPQSAIVAGELKSMLFPFSRLLTVFTHLQSPCLRNTSSTRTLFSDRMPKTPCSRDRVLSEGSPN
jgi:hypothetical protein